jgi:hypothetical protein
LKKLTLIILFILTVRLAECPPLPQFRGPITIGHFRALYPDWDRWAEKDRQTVLKMYRTAEDKRCWNRELMRAYGTPL